jgi:glycosyltransferase involved in cell wall biosynthesis
VLRDRWHGVGGGDDRYHRHYLHHGHCLHRMQGLSQLRSAISVLIPARNEQARLAPTIRSIARARTTGARVEFVVVDDASTDGCIENLISAVPELLGEPEIDIRVCALDEHSGIYRSRNRAAAIASGEIFFITDAHVRFSTGWDAYVFEHTRPNRILAGTTTEGASGFRGHGCRLLVPFMGTAWIKESLEGLRPVPIAACSATILPRELFERLGGYDEGMMHYGGGEPEFSVRAWLKGAEILALGDIEVQHEFKSKGNLLQFLSRVRPSWVHNCIRFGLLYLSELGCMQLLRYYSRAFPAAFPNALKMIAAGNVWERRAFLEGHTERTFDWFVAHFGIKNQIGGEII